MMGKKLFVALAAALSIGAAAVPVLAATPAAARTDNASIASLNTEQGAQFCGGYGGYDDGYGCYGGRW